MKIKIIYNILEEIRKILTDYGLDTEGIMEGEA